MYHHPSPRFPPAGTYGKQGRDESRTIAANSRTGGGRSTMKRPPWREHPCRLIFMVWAAAFLLSLATGASLATGPPAGSAPGGTDNAIGAATIATDNATGAVPSPSDNVTGALPTAADNGWVDRTHSRVEKYLFRATVWFDRFFGDDRVMVTETPESFLRWKSDFRWDEEENFSYRGTVRASLRLPRLKNRWRVMISSESRGDPNAIIPEDPGNPALETGRRGRTSSTELVYDILRTAHSFLGVGAGVRVKIPPDAFLRTRFQHARPIALNTLGRFTATAFWEATDGFGESNQVELEHWLAPPTLLRWSNSFEIKEKDDGWTWGTELSLLHKISPKSAITFAGGVLGATRPAWSAENYRVLVRYRRNVYRKWLFLEGEPDIHWPRKEGEDRKPVWGATLRVEILFTGAADGGSDL
jgi:hypothetical protein